MDKRKIKAICLLIILVLFQSTIYFLTKLVQGKPTLLNSVIDNRIPYISWFIYFYIIWYLMLFVIPFVIYIKDKDEFYKYVTTYIISILISGVIFIIFPTTINRANITGAGISDKLVKLIYSMDEPSVNCLPSIHCLIAFLFMLGISKVNISKLYKYGVYILSICIVFSTLAIKQHVIYDAVASLIIAIVVWTSVDRSKIYLKLKKTINKT